MPRWIVMKQKEEEMPTEHVKRINIFGETRQTKSKSQSKCENG
jgi:hypothetical protein